MERTAEAVAGMVDEARSERARAIVAVGTAGLRIANNRDEVLEAIRTRAGIAIDVISGEEEGRLAYVAVRAGLGSVEGSLVVFDTGGGSSQFTFGHGEQVDERFSVEVGAVRYTEGFGLDRGGRAGCAARGALGRSRPISLGSTAVPRPTPWSRWAAR